MEKRGRPALKLPTEESPTKFTREFNTKNGISTKWHFNLDKTINGPVMVEIFHPDNSYEEKNQEDLPKTKRKYFNPKTGKMVNYFRYQQLLKEGSI